MHANRGVRPGSTATGGLWRKWRRQSRRRAATGRRYAGRRATRRRKAAARPTAARRAQRGSAEPRMGGTHNEPNCGQGGANCAVPEVPEGDRRAPQGTDRAPLPPAQSTAWRTRSGQGGLGGSARRARAGGRGAGPQERKFRGWAHGGFLGARPLLDVDRRLQAEFVAPNRKNS